MRLTGRGDREVRGLTSWGTTWPDAHRGSLTSLWPTANARCPSANASPSTCSTHQPPTAPLPQRGRELIEPEVVNRFLGRVTRRGSPDVQLSKSPRKGLQLGLLYISRQTPSRQARANPACCVASSLPARPSAHPGTETGRREGFVLRIKVSSSVFQAGGPASPFSSSLLLQPRTFARFSSVSQLAAGLASAGLAGS